MKYISQKGMTQRALLFGLNYLSDSEAALSGCINDARNLQSLLVGHMGYQEDDILMCTDESPIKPTRDTMLRLIRDLCLYTHRRHVKQIFISYSGHGTSVADTSGDEKDGRDEVLVPLDYRTNGTITDDELGTLIRQIHPRTDCVLLIDACHSGTMMDFPYRYVSGNKYALEGKGSIPCRTIMISGCRDDQTAQEVWSFNDEKQISGLMTSCFIHALSHHSFDITCWKLIKYMQNHISELGAAQRPQLSTSRQLSETCIFMSNVDNGQPFFLNQ